jgi:hypothetical protein
MPAGNKREFEAIDTIIEPSSGHQNMHEQAMVVVERIL